MPSSSVKYSLRDIQSIFQKQYGFKPQIACYQNNLSELRFCYAKDNVFQVWICFFFDFFFSRILKFTDKILILIKQMIDCKSYPTNCSSHLIFIFFLFFFWRNCWIYCVYFFLSWKKLILIVWNSGPETIYLPPIKAGKYN